MKQTRDFIEGRGTRKTTLHFSLPEMGGEQTWEHWLYPAMIGVANGKVYVVGRASGTRQFSMYLHPKYAYVAFEWRDSEFQRIPFLSVPEQLRTRENVRWCHPGGDDSKKPVQPPGAWCIERVSIDDKFPKPQAVALDVRTAEAAFMARLVNSVPASD